MLDCVQNTTQGYTLMEVVRRIVADLGIPVAYGLPSGHVSRPNITLPFGARAKLVVNDTVRFTILDPPTQLRRAWLRRLAVRNARIAGFWESKTVISSDFVGRRGLRRTR